MQHVCVMYIKCIPPTVCMRVYALVHTVKLVRGILKWKYFKNPKCLLLFLAAAPTVKPIWCQVLANGRFRKRAKGEEPEPDS